MPLRFLLSAVVVVRAVVGAPTGTEDVGAPCRTPDVAAQPNIYDVDPARPRVPPSYTGSLRQVHGPTGIPDVGDPMASFAAQHEAGDVFTWGDPFVLVLVIAQNVYEQCTARCARWKLAIRISQCGSSSSQSLLDITPQVTLKTFVPSVSSSLGVWTCGAVGVVSVDSLPGALPVGNGLCVQALAEKTPNRFRKMMERFHVGERESGASALTLLAESKPFRIRPKAALDFVPHGSPSTTLFDAFLREIEERPQLGLYRTSAMKHDTDRMSVVLREGRAHAGDLRHVDVHALACATKRIVGEVNDLKPFISRVGLAQLKTCTGMANFDSAYCARAFFAPQVDEDARPMLIAILSHLHRLQAKQDVTQMSEKNLAIVFVNNLVEPESWMSTSFHDDINAVAWLIRHVNILQPGRALMGASL